jgi:hypothetical protein
VNFVETEFLGTGYLTGKREKRAFPRGAGDLFHLTVDVLALIIDIKMGPIGSLQPLTVGELGTNVR